MRILDYAIISATLILGGQAFAQIAPASPGMRTTGSDVTNSSNCDNPNLKYFCKAMKRQDPDISGTLGSQNGTGASTNLQKQVDPFQ